MSLDERTVQQVWGFCHLVIVWPALTDSGRCMPDAPYSALSISDEQKPA